MEQKLFSKLNLYDQIGFILVGAVAILVLIFNGVFFFNLPFPPYSLDILPLWILLSYLLGHTVQSISNFITSLPLLNSLISEKKKDFREQEKEILKQAERYFKVKKQDPDFIWNLCYVFSLAKDITGHVQIFNANYSLYRGWFTIFLIESIFLVYIYSQNNRSIENLLLLLSSIMITFAMYRRANRFWSYTRSKVLQTFIVVKTLGL